MLDNPQVVDKTTQEAEIIMQYVKNTHAATHNTYTLEVQDVRHYYTFVYKICISYLVSSSRLLLV